jgi:hypothetical protein
LTVKRRNAESVNPRRSRYQCRRRRSKEDVTMKRWCIWCETGADPKKSNYMWIHQKCFFEMHEGVGLIEGVKKRLDEGKSFKEIADYIKSMEDFSRRWDNVMEKLNIDPNTYRPKEG